MPSVPDQLRALESIADALERLGVAYALIGGLAVGAISGVARATQDVNLAVPSDLVRSELIAGLRAAGFRLVGEFEHSVNFRHASGEPVQLAMDPEFDAMIARAEPLSLGARTIPVVCRDDLIAMKQRAAADPKRRRSKALRDQADVALLLGDVPELDEGW